MAQEPVPNIFEELKKYPRFETAVTYMVFNNPFGRIHGHNPEKIELSMYTDLTAAIIVFVFPESFVLHKDRILSCRFINEEWECEEFKKNYASQN